MPISFVILVTTLLLEICLAMLLPRNKGSNVYRRPYVAIKTRHLVDMDRISTKRY